MHKSASLLLLDDGGRLAVLAHRLRRMGYRLLSAKTCDDACRMTERRRLEVGAVLLPGDLPAPDLRVALETLRARLGGHAMGLLAVGVRPDPESRRALRVAGVELAAWEPCEDGTLRFQVNRALAGPSDGAARCETRVPADVPAQIEASGRSKAAMVRSISASGAFFETGRPSLPGVDLAIELSVSPETVRLEGRVVYANVPGNLHRRNLPVGMAVRFTALGERAERAIRHCVAQRALSLVV
jgi:hypothetical protein